MCTQALGAKIASVRMDRLWLEAVEPSRNAGYDVVLLAHILAVIASFGAVVVAGAYAIVLSRPGPIPDGVARYYRPGVNWAGRVLFAVPVLGFVLMAMSDGDWTFSDGWIVIGLVLWVAAASVAEMALWPSERRLQELVAGLARVGADDEPMTGPTGNAGAGAVRPADVRSPSLRTAALSAVVAAILVAASVVMVAKP
jgi:hypothetical protein